MAEDVLAQPDQLDDALWRVDSAGLSGVEAAGLVVCGMGGSAIGGDLALACIGERLARPIRVVRDYSPGPVDGELVLCASYSGDTEETLACYRAAEAAGAQRVVLTTGGALADAARTDGVPVIGAPAGLQPRAAVIYLTVGVLACAAQSGAAPSLRVEVEAARGPLSELAAEWGPDGDENAPPKELARRLAGSLPVIYGAGETAAAARRWKTQINENAKLPAFFSELPEANHNEICGLGAGSGLAPLHTVVLETGATEPRLRRRLEETARMAAEAGVGSDVVTAEGDSAVERVLAAVLYGDLLSVYLAVARGVDPTPVEPIEQLKKRLAAAP